MRILPFSRGALLCCLVSLLFAVSFCHGGSGNKVVEVVGTGECADCAESNFKTSQAFSGLRVTIDCKPKNGEFKTRGVVELDEEGKFKVSLPAEIVEDEKLTEECYAQLHSASATPCPAHGGLESAKIVFKIKNEDKQTFGLPGKLKFSPVTCASAFFVPYFKQPPLPKLPPLPKITFPFPPKIFPPEYKKPSPPTKKALPAPVPRAPKPLPPKPPVTEKPFPPKPPVFKKPPPIPKVLPPPFPTYKPKPPVPIVLPPPIPTYKPKPSVAKVLPPPIPTYKPKPSVAKVLPPPIPTYKPKPPVPIVLPPPIPTYKPKPPVPIVLPPPVPIYKPKSPIFVKPLPPLPKIPPFYKKPFPPLPKLPPKYFHHPKFGKCPPLPTFASHP